MKIKIYKKVNSLKTFYFLLPFLVLTNVFAKAEENNVVKSPDGFISIEFKVNNEGVPEFDILYQNELVMKNNRLGLIRDDADFSRNLKLISVSLIEKMTDDYTMLYGKKIHCSYQGNRKSFHLQNEQEVNIDIIFQLSNDGIAFRYYFEGNSIEKKKITYELTYFNFNEGTLAWIQPMSAAKSGWNKVNPAYEEYYYQEINVKELPNIEPGWVFPALFKSGEYWISLTETAPDRDYCGCRLIHDTTSTIFKIGFPQDAEVFPGGPLKPESQLPWYSPWRIITIGNYLGTLVESTLGTDLAKPSVIQDVSFVKPGRSSWSWVLMKDDSTIYPVQKRFIDYAAKMNWEYCLMDAYWDSQIGYEKLGELCGYADSKGIDINVWYNSAGDWNTTPLTPRDKLLTKNLRETEFEKIKNLGVKGIKVDFFGADGQSMMSYYQDIFEDAAHYELMVNCHGSTLPRGWQRTYPNLVSMEAIKGFEFVTFDQYNADKEANHCTVIPFTRNLFDPMDFTPVCFSEVPNIQRKTTNSFELALSVLFISGIQHFAEIPEGMVTVPEEVKQILREVPVTWDETKFIDGYPGKYVVIARRKDKIWYVAGINSQAEKNIELDLGFINNPLKYSLFLSSIDNRSFEIKSESISTEMPLKINLKPQDGFLYKISTE